MPDNIGDSDFTVSGNLLLYRRRHEPIDLQHRPGPVTPVVAQVTIPTGNGVSIVPDSFNIAPTTITTGPELRDAPVGPHVLRLTRPARTFTWQETLDGVEPGQSIAGGTGLAAVTFTDQGTNTTLNLPDAGRHRHGDHRAQRRPLRRWRRRHGHLHRRALESDNRDFGQLRPRGSRAYRRAGSTWDPLDDSSRDRTSRRRQHGQRCRLMLTSDPFAPTGADGFAVTVIDADGSTSAVQGDTGPPRNTGVPPILIRTWDRW